MSIASDTLNAFKEAQDINKAGYSQGTGLVNYDLQSPAKLLYPIITPLRNRIPRVAANGGTATHWKSITSINSLNTHAGVTEGQRGGAVTPTLVDKLASYRSLGIEQFATFEADNASVGFDDVKARAVEGSLQGLMVQEERMILGGNNSVAFGTTATPTTATATTGGTLAAQTWSIICVALTMDGMKESSIANGVMVPYTRTNTDSSTDTVTGFHGAKSVAASQATTGATSTISASVTAVAGAAGYAWFYGLSGSEVLGALTSINSVLITAAAVGTQNATAIVGDKSQDALAFDGILAQIITGSSGAEVVALATGTAGTGTVLTSDGAGGVVQIESMLQRFWDNSRNSPDTLYMNATTMLAVNKIVIANGGAPLIRFNGDMGATHTISAGAVVGNYLNKITGQLLKVEVHPDMPSGMILFYSEKVPAQYYPYTNTGNIIQMKTRKDYYQIEWPLRTRKYEYGVYADEALEMYFMPAFGLLTNIAV